MNVLDKIEITDIQRTTITERRQQVDVWRVNFRYELEGKAVVSMEVYADHSMKPEDAIVYARHYFQGQCGALHEAASGWAIKKT